MNATLTREPGHQAPVTSLFEEFEVASAFQPIISPTHNRVVGVEALARPSHKGLPVSPAEIFNRTDGKPHNGDLDLKLWQQHLHNFARQLPPAWLFLNVSADSIGAPGISPRILADQVRQAGLGCDQVVLEIVEQAVASEQLLQDFVEDARRLGFRVAVDDFGAGDANFERVWRLQPFIVKMDRAMVVHAAANESARKLFISLVRLIRENGSLVLVEGVETRQQAEIAMQSEADLYQGFYFARPSQVLNQDQETLDRFRVFQEDYNQCQHLQARKHEEQLRHLRFEILAACHSLARQEPLQLVAEPLLRIPGVARCFLLDHRGIQQGPVAVSERGNRRFLKPDFNPLYQSQGASWSHREYFLRAIDNPSQINVSRPYVALPDTRSTVTISAQTFTRRGNRILCVDLHPEIAFPGLQELPDTL
ncbi:MAG: EAL domain-containing protein [Oleiphilaceae bacterium]|nr:EAL domain-containing protein [Oleiphilaceae bacterium]